MKNFALIAAIALPLAACNSNTAPGNDREAQLDPPATAAPIEDAATALANVSPGLMLPETMNGADIAALGAQNSCQFRLTEIAFPSFVYDDSGQGAVTADGPDSYSNGELRIKTRMLDDEGDAGLQMQEMIVAAPRAKDEFGFWGYTTCPSGGA